MNFIIEISEGLYFAGWDANIGSIKTIDDINLAYRMRYPIASKTLPKIISEFGTGEIKHL